MASASASAVSSIMSVANTTQMKAPNADAFLKPLSLKPSKIAANSSRRSIRVRASLKEKALTGLTAAALTASMVVPDVAEAAEVSPSLKNFLLSIAAGGVVLVAIIGAVVGVSNFDPVKRG